MYKIFISHSWSYGDAYDSLVQLLDSDPFFQYYNYSVPKNDPVHNAANDRELAFAIANKMQYADTVLVLAGVYSSFSKWIQNEIHIAKNVFTFPKPIIAIQPWGAEKTSQIVKDSADRIVGWRGKSITDAIRDLSGERAYG